MAIEVRFLLELLHIVAVAARVHLPVDTGEVVARQVLPVLCELDAEPLEGAAMEPRQKSFDDGARLQLERPEPRDDRGVEKPELSRARMGSHGGYKPLLGTGTASRSRVTMPSELMRSDSA